LNGLKIR
jgi:hypothetical protein